MADWVYFLHAPRDDFAATMTDAERDVWDRHVAFLTELFERGDLIVAGPTLGRVNTGISIFEAPDEDAARAIVDADPAVVSGIARGELRPYRATFLRGR